jgi:molybdenum storage protein
MDRGRSALAPLLEEIVANRQKHRMIIGVGAGVRTRHIFSVGLDLGLPTGALAALSAKDAAQNAYIVSCLLAQYGFVYLEAPFVVQLLPAMLAAARGAVFNGIPPYSLWEHPPLLGKLPPHGSDAGSYLVAEVFGTRSMIFLKDVEGLYTADPKIHPAAEYIPEIRAHELMERKLPTLPIEPAVLELLTRARLRRSVRIVNGLTPGNLSRALERESIGTVIYQ